MCSGNKHSTNACQTNTKLCINNGIKASHLGSHKLRSANYRAFDPARFEDHGKTKVADLDRACGPFDKDVVALEVTVDDSLVVHVSAKRGGVGGMNIHVADAFSIAQTPQFNAH
jgi:hypothetical protein